MDNEEELAEISAARSEWEHRWGAEFETERKEGFFTQSGIPVRRCYTPLDLKEQEFDYLRALGFPGEYPYTRGPTPTMYRSGLWTVSKRSGHATPEETNRLWKTLIAAGANPFIAEDLPSQVGYDPDDPRAEGEVGRVGMSFVSLRDWEIAFDGIDLNKVIVSNVANAMAAVHIGSHVALAEKRGIDPRMIRGMCQNDILKEYTSRGLYRFPPEPSVRLVIDSMAYCAKYLPNYIPMQICSWHFQESGVEAVQQVAFALANMITYLDAAAERGIDVDSIAPGVIWGTYTQHAPFFEEIAKVRAMRKIWARLMRERFGAKKPESLALRVYSNGGGSRFYRERYLLNIARAAISCMAGTLAGVQVYEGNPYDEQYGICTADSILVSLGTQSVVTHETGITDTVDPLAGSYYVEWLTSELEHRILKELEKIEELGGALKCIELGYFQREQAAGAYERQRAIESGEIPVVGVNIFKEKEEERPITIYRADPKVEKARIAAVEKLKRSRNNQEVMRALNRIREVASEPSSANSNLMVPIIEAVKCYATKGEIANALVEVWGEYRDTSL